MKTKGELFLKKYLEPLREAVHIICSNLTNSGYFRREFIVSFSKRFDKKEILFSSNESVEILNTLIDKTISEKINDITVFSEDIDSSKYEQQGSAVLTKFQQYIKLNPDVQSIYIGTNEGAFF